MLNGSDREETAVLDRLGLLLADHEPSNTDPVVFLGAQYDAGLAWVQFPEGYGGLGVSPALQKTVNERLAEAGAPNTYVQNPVGYGIVAPTIAAHGRDDQKQRFLRPLFTGEEIWCQLFSEPGAGSDVAALSTRAVQDGDEWVVNGQKVWTSLAHFSRWGVLVARTDPGQPKHRGLTYFITDMTAPGIDIRPLRQMTGDAEFNEVYLTDVRIPDRDRLAGVGEGWNVVITTLMNERVTIGGKVAPRDSGPIGAALRLWEQREVGDRDRATSDRLMQLWIRSEVNRLTNIRAAQNRALGTPGPEGSVAKVALTETNKDVYAFCMDLLGASGTLYGSYEMHRTDTVTDSATLQKAFLRSRANSIEGGTSEILRNILGERVLGLPGDVRVDKDGPWSSQLRA